MVGSVAGSATATTAAVGVLVGSTGTGVAVWVGVGEGSAVGVEVGGSVGSTASVSSFSSVGVAVGGDWLWPSMAATVAATALSISDWMSTNEDGDAIREHALSADERTKTSKLAVKNQRNCRVFIFHLLVNKASRYLNFDKLLAPNPFRYKSIIQWF